MSSVCPCVQCKVYLVEDVLMNFLLGILEGGGSVDEHPLIQQLLDLFWLLMEVNVMHSLTLSVYVRASSGFDFLPWPHLVCRTMK